MRAAPRADRVSAAEAEASPVIYVILPWNGGNLLLRVDGARSTQIGFVIVADLLTRHGMEDAPLDAADIKL